jgi:SAM-dependent methyltransferase
MLPSMAPPSSWVTAWAGLIPAGSPVLDVAAGSGRHTTFFADRGHRVTAIERDEGKLPQRDDVEIVIADLEGGAPWPLPGRKFGAVVVTNYLHRPLIPTLIESLSAGSVLIYETFMQGNERFGKPSNPDYLLKDGELLDLVRGRFSVTAYEARIITEPHMAMVQRIAARKLSAPAIQAHSR